MNRGFVTQICGWRMWGVLLCGMANVLLYERGGELLGMFTLLLCLIGLPIIGGLLTQEMPAFTVAVFALGSVPPLNDMPPIPIVLWLWANLQLSYQPIFVLMFTVAALIAMAVPYTALVYLGWTMRYLADVNAFRKR